MTSIDELKKKFSSANDAYRPVPWWAWNGDMDELVMYEQLQELYDKGIREVMIFPLYGLEVEYLSNEWWEKVTFAIEEARNIGIKIWIYDEYNWPSGTAGGKLIRDYPEFMETGLRCNWIEVAPGKAVEFELSGELVEVIQIRPEEKSLKITEECKISGTTLEWANNKNFPCSVICINTEINRKIYPSCGGGETWNTNQEGSLDVMNPDAVRKFLDYTHEEYKKRYGRYFGSIIPAFFTDEPQFHFSIGPDSCFLPFTWKMFKSFEDKYGYDIKDKLPEIIFDYGDFLKTRDDYWSFVSELICNNYHRQVSLWCEKNSLKYTGHLMHEENFSHLSKNGILNEALKWMHIPGMDLLGKATGFSEEKTNSFRMAPGKFNFTAKMISSVAIHYQRERTICEAFGVAGYDISFADFKRITDWLTALGINTINFNNIPYSAKSYRKLEAPGFTAPWWQYFDLYSEYAARVCMMSAQGKTQNKLAVLHPATTLRCLFSPALKKGENINFAAVENSVHTLGEALLRIHWDFDFIFEELMDDAVVINGELKVKENSYSVILLPSNKVITENVYLKLKEFVDSGGTIIFIDMVPDIIIDNDNSKLNIFLNKHNVIKLRTQSEIEKFENILDQNLKGIMPKELAVSGKDARFIVTSIRHYKDRKIYFLANQLDRQVKAKIKIKDNGKLLEIWHPDNGRQYAFDKKHEAIINFAPGEAFYIVESEADCNLSHYNFFRENERIELPARWKFHTKTPNTFCLNNIKMKLDYAGQGMEEQWFLSGDDFFDYTIKDKAEYDNYGHPSVRVLKTYVEDASTIWLRSSFYYKGVSDVGMNLVLDNPGWHEIFLNGEPLTEYSHEKIWTHENIVFPLKGKLVVGKNSITIRKKVSEEFSYKVFEAINYGCPRIDPIVLRGRFSVYDNCIETESIELNLKSWHSQGYPNYSGTGVYEQKIKIDTIHDDHLYLEFEKVNGILEVEINGNSAGICCWPPYRLNIEGLVKPGENTIKLRVTNNLSNLLSLPGSSGIIGRILIKAWKPVE